MTEYPQYRKYVGIDTWFKIISDAEFIEIKAIGNQYIKTVVKAEQFPEKMLIQDMLSCKDGRWEVVSASDFNEVYL